MDASTSPFSLDGNTQEKLCAFALVLVAGMLLYRLKTWGEELPAKDLRTARLTAYRQRHHWRKADASNLRSLGLSLIAERKLQRAEAVRIRGRGVISKYHPPEARLRGMLRWLNTYASPDTPRKERLRLLRQHASWWPQVVEALYRGEYRALKAEGVRSPSEETERLLARDLYISSSMVHRLCTEVRRDRRLGFEDSPELRLRDFNAWLEEGGSLWPGDQTAIGI